MQTRISTRHGAISDATRDRISAKLEKLPRIFDRITDIEVTVDLERRDAPAVDLRVSAEHKHDFVATAQADELMAALDVVMRKLEQQLRRYKERIQNRHRSPGNRKQEAPTEPGTAAE